MCNHIQVKRITNMAKHNIILKSHSLIFDIWDLIGRKFFIYNVCLLQIEPVICNSRICLSHNICQILRNNPHFNFLAPTGARGEVMFCERPCVRPWHYSKELLKWVLESSSKQESEQVSRQASKQASTNVFTRMLWWPSFDFNRDA